MVGVAFDPTEVQGNILRFVPPLVITPEEIDALIVCLDALFSEVG